MAFILKRSINYVRVENPTEIHRKILLGAKVGLKHAANRRVSLLTGFRNKVLL